ncbi:oxidation resistance 2 [Hibiscus trionum]|uniref:Oxidation resistance 2 n=1 Tax=Hibiscus trionum TaxID=183268 RepID=A0A9W7MLN5_HIBTR|nr:oxidation resistance 2 [Hibiscus trionum]
MSTLKDKVAGSLSRLFADSPSRSSPSSAPDLSRARWYSKGSKSLSSIVSYITPPLSYGESELNDNGTNLKPLQSHPVRWKSYKLEMQHEVPNCGKECTAAFTSKEFKKTGADKKKVWTRNDDKQMVVKPSRNNFETQCEASHSDEEYSTPCTSRELKKASVDKKKIWTHNDDKQMVVKLSPHGENKDCIFESIGTDSQEFQEAREQQSPMKSPPKLSDESVFINYDLYEFLMCSLPNIVKGCQWMLLYSTLKHGISLRTLIRRSAAIPGPCLLITGDKQGDVFGAMLECPLKPTPKRKYQGTNQTFVFTTKYGEPRLFRPTGANRYYYICMNDMLALGGGGNFALSFDGDLLSGTSGPCETFGNLCLARNEDFELKNVELWGFTHAS